LWIVGVTVLGHSLSRALLCRDRMAESRLPPAERDQILAEMGQFLKGIQGIVTAANGRMPKRHRSWRSSRRYGHGGPMLSRPSWWSCHRHLSRWTCPLIATSTPSPTASHKQRSALKPYSDCAASWADAHRVMSCIGSQRSDSNILKEAYCQGIVASILKTLDFVWCGCCRFRMVVLFPRSTWWFQFPL